MKPIKHKLIEDLKVSNSAVKLREAVEKAIKDEVITREEYDRIITIAAADGVIDTHEQIILKEFHQMIYDQDIKFKTL
jgi:hypothetical protein